MPELNEDAVEKLRANFGEALTSLNDQKKKLLGKHKVDRDQINKKIKEVEDKIVETEKYKKS